ncbi:hypothetical protein [Rubrivirga sp.]|uniref:hypothetical protein n=1 Tax=Rubrivirga sp. TaxID=1885344 RepID=UPI003B51F049
MRTLPALLVLAVSLAACDSSGDSGGAAAELASSNAKVSQALSVGLSGGAGAFAEAARVRPVYDCPGGGSVDVSQSGTRYSMAFDDCYDVSGAFDVASTFSTSSSAVSAASRLDGDLRVAGGCDLAYSGFRTTTETALASNETTLRYDGSITASCPSGTTSCRFDGATFEIGADGSGAPASLDAFCE